MTEEVRCEEQLVIANQNIPPKHALEQIQLHLSATQEYLLSPLDVSAARAFRVPEITIAMATAAWVDMVIDPKLLKMSNHSRNRRAFFLGALIAGSFAGAFAFSKLGSPAALLISAAGKAVVTAMM